jgi:U3 small nucleolar RNA-associated protein 15
LSNRDEITLQPVLRAMTRLVADPRFVAAAVEVGLLVVDMYSANLGQSSEIDQLIRRLHEKVQRELSNAQQACQMSGMLQMLISQNRV